MWAHLFSGAAVSVADLSIVVAALTVAFVVPTYLAYITREEEMMRNVFGDAYQSYCSRVPRFIPSLRRGIR